MSKGYIGSRIPRLDAYRHLVGKGQYIDDWNLPGLVYAHFLRSPHAHAQIRWIDCREAEKAPGVIGVWTWQRIRSKVKGIRPVLESESYRVGLRPLLAAEKVRFVGEAVAVVIATDRYRAEDAAERILVDYLPLEPLPDAQASLNSNGIRLHEESPDNIFFEYKLATGDVDAAFRDADIRLVRDFQHPRCTGLPIENRGVVAQYDPSRQFLTVWSSTQVPDFLRKVLAECLDHPAHRLRVIAPDVGGGFGTKMHIYPEELIVAFLARELRLPVKWIEDRSENLMASMHAREHTVRAEIAARKDGTILGLRVQDWSDVGAYSAFPVTCGLEILTFASILPGPYQVANYSYQGKAIGTDKCPVGAYRGVGFVLGPLVIEGLLDEVARALRIDPAEVRRRNSLGSIPAPYQAPGGIVYDSGEYRRILERALELADYDGWRKRQNELRAEGRYIGIGISNFIEPTGMGRRVFRRRGMAEVPGFDSARITVDSGGTVRAYLSTPSQGQGLETTFAQLLAEELGLRIEDIRISLGDTETCPAGTGTFASRSLVSAGSALVLAAREMRQRLLCAAGHLLRVLPDELNMEHSEIRRKAGDGPALSLAELTRAIHRSHDEFPGDGNMDWEVSRTFSAEGAAVSYGTHIAVVEVDPETGIVKILRYVAAEDCGKMINPTIVDGQVRGGVAQGIGSALYEDLRYDSQGQLLTATLMDYLVPGSTEIPEVEVEHLETPSPLTPTGCKGVGESGAIASPAAIANAVSDALAPFRISFTSLPIRPQDIVEALAKHGRTNG